MTEFFSKRKILSPRDEFSRKHFQDFESIKLREQNKPTISLLNWMTIHKESIKMGVSLSPVLFHFEKVKTVEGVNPRPNAAK